VSFLDDPAAPALDPEAPAGTTVRPMVTADISAGVRLCRLSRWDQVARDWERFLNASPGGVSVASRDGQTIGTVATIRYGARFAWIGMVLVDPDARGRGLGTVLLGHALDLLQDVPIIRLDATPAGHQIYAKRGFTEEYRLRRMQAVAPARPVPVCLADVRPMTADDLVRVLAWDEQIFGAPRTEMLRWMQDGAPHYAWIASREGAIVGYMFGRHGFRFEHLGPIVAADVAVATHLVTACLSHHPGREFAIDAPTLSPAWMHALAEMGFREQRPFIRMQRGGQPPFGEPDQQFAVLGPEFG